jgi:hypothetical protein
MMPPTVAMNPNKPDLSAPLAKWVAHEEMDTLSMCEHQRKQEIALEHNPYSLYQQYIEAEKSSRPKGSVFNIAQMQEFADAQKCIAIDDRRLTGDHDPDLRDAGQ